MALSSDFTEKSIFYNKKEVALTARNGLPEVELFVALFLFYRWSYFYLSIRPIRFIGR